MKGMAKALALAAGCVACFFLATLMFAVFFDWNRARPAISHLVSATLHRPFSINGPLALTWSREGATAGGTSDWQKQVPWPHVDLQDMTLGNPGPTGTTAALPDFLTIHHLAFSVDPQRCFDNG